MPDYNNSRLTLLRGACSFLIMLLLLGVFFAPNALVHAQEGTTYPVYIVRSGDTLSDIAMRFYTTVDDLKSLNNWTNADTLHPGDRLMVPGLSGMKGVLVSINTPLGASLTTMSRRSQTQPNDLVKLNKLTSPSELYVGREVVIAQEEGGTPLDTLPAMLPGETYLEAALLSGENPWQLALLNRLESPNAALPMDTYFAPAEEAGENNLAIPGVKSILINNLPFRQGNTWVVKVEQSEPLEITAELNGVKPPFFSTQEGYQVALGGIHALVEPGVYPLNLTFTYQNGQTYRFEQLVMIASADFEWDAPLYVDPATLDDENVAKEDEIFTELVAHATPVQQWNGIFINPTQEPVCVRSEFGSRRTYNNDPRLFYHTGLDLGYCGGVDIMAPAKGTVVAAMPDLIVRGNTIVIDHGLGVYTTYMHLKDILVEKGDIVEPGQLIGHMGNTGRSIGPHLHFQVDVNGIPVNPSTWLYREFP
ncbi:MAG: peptidoglycan DD-metalloendopeptidase family protein [Anaerolineaceae bacterium]|jgi:murein DD-endopeptidase MepM/ murein hydrolase activator NlpD